MEDTAVAVRERGSLAEYDVSDIVGQVQKIQAVMQAVMKDGEHYGKIPGCGDKPSLLKPGAEKLGFMFRLAPAFQEERIDLGNGHREYVIRCVLTHIPSGQIVGEGLGSCSTMESKYRFRTGPKEFTGQPVPKEYWNLRTSDPAKAMAAIGGRGHTVGKTEAGAWEVCIQGERVEHDNPADHYNTVLKIGKKRAHVDAVLTATAASDFFTQDIEDLRDNGVVGEADKVQPKAMAPGPAMPQRRSESPARDEPTAPLIDSTPSSEGSGLSGPEPICPTCGGAMKFKAEGKWGAWWSCTKYPICKGSVNDKKFRESAPKMTVTDPSQHPSFGTEDAGDDLFKK